MVRKIRDNVGDLDNLSGPRLGEPAFWDMDSPDHECDCPGPPPQFYIPPPPRPPSIIDSDCSERPISDLETCEAVPVSIQFPKINFYINDNVLIFSLGLCSGDRCRIPFQSSHTIFGSNFNHRCNCYGVPLYRNRPSRLKVSCNTVI